MSAATARLSPVRRAALLTALLAGPPAVVLGLVGLLVGPVVALVVFVLVAVAASAWIRLLAPRRLVASLPGEPADSIAHARLLNLVEGLCAGAGLRQPRIVVLDDPGLNTMVAGTGADRATLVVTTGLVENLKRVELEAVLAEQMVQIRKLEILPATISAAMFGWGSHLAVPPERDADNDQAAVSLTRYPPGLIAALVRMDEAGTALAGVARGHAHLWLADPAATASEATAIASRHLPMVERIGALREL